MTTADFEPPGPGHWELDRSHFTGGATPIMKWLITESVEQGFRKLWRTFGIPAETLSMRFVHGFAYTRLRPLVRPDHPSPKAPPAVVLKIASRLHPEFRRRARAAEAVLADSPAPAVIEEWRRHTRPRLAQRNTELQEVHLSALADHELAGHLETVLAHIRWTFEEHFRLHGFDLGPIGQLLLAGKGWGIEGAEMVPALAGASPSTAAPREALARMRRMIQEAGLQPGSLEEVAAASPELAAELESYLRERGSVLYAGYDLDTPTLGEAPHVVLSTILNDSAHRALDPAQLESTIAGLRKRVPEDDREEFDDLLHRAREAMDLRDDNGPITAEWPAGVLRLGMLEAGRRLTARGRLHQPEHVFELDQRELPAVVGGDADPDADAVAERARIRAWEKTLDPPRSIGDPEAEPPLDALPAPLAAMVELVQTVIAEMGMSDVPASADGITGTGVGSEPYEGRARTAANAEEAFDKLEPGDVLVTRTTSPAYNMVLTLVGGLVTAEGGPMCHAAVLSRELNIPAVVGANGALEAIADGDMVRIDPTTGSVTVTG